jgi:hypothetical protein
LGFAVFFATAFLVFLAVAGLAAASPVVAPLCDGVLVCEAQGRTSGSPDLAALSAFAASFFKAASDLQPAFVPLLEPSAGVPTTQMHALLPPHAFSSRPLQDTDAFAFFVLGFAGAAVA